MLYKIVQKTKMRATAQVPLCEDADSQTEITASIAVLLRHVESLGADADPYLV